ncbi:MAG: lipoyl synthase [Acidimicrobiia bacterium]
MITGVQSRATVLQARWCGRVGYAEGDTLQRALHAGADDYLLLLEHPHVYTLGTQADLAHVLVEPATVGAELVAVDRGGDVTYHGPGQLVGYPIVTLPEGRDGMRDVVAYLRRVEDALIAALADLGVAAGRNDGYTGVWVGDEKIAAIGVKVARGRTRHGFALNVAPDLAMFGHIVPCGIADKGVTSLQQLLGADTPSMQTVVEVVTARFAEHFGYDEVVRADVVWRERVSDLTAFTRAAMEGQLEPGSDEPITPSRGREALQARAAARGTEVPVRLLGRLREAGVDATAGVRRDRPEWMRVKANLGTEYRALKKIVADRGLTTVCEEAGCPNIYECWADGTATFMILGERCTRACGFCLVDTRKPLPVELDEPERVADAVAQLGLSHAVITTVARDDLDDDGAAIFAATVHAIRARTPDTRVELLISDCRGNGASLDTIFASRPDVLNHNLETVARLQRAARPSAGYARSLAVLARAKAAGLVTKSGIIVGMGETDDEVRIAIRDLANVGVDIVTIGQYLQPTDQHLPIDRWVHPDTFAQYAAFGEELGIAHVESGPLVRSSYHAKRGAEAADGAVSGDTAPLTAATFA